LTTTLSDLINEVSINLAGYTYQQDRATHLTSAVTTTTSSSASPTILSLGSTENLGKGVVEIDEELLWVTISPTFPRYVVKKAINDTVNAVGSTIYSAKVTTFTFNAAQTTYDFDNLNIQNILTIMWQSVGPSQEWIPVRRWSWDSKADATAFGATAQTVTIGDYITPGRTVKVVYSTDPTSFSELATVALTNAQVFETVSGLPSSCKDVIVLGASYRLLTYLDPARAGQVSPQADETDSKRPYGASQSATKQLYALYTQRLNEETQRQQTLYPIRVHYSR
jgi:hypothetical protein